MYRDTDAPLASTSASGRTEYPEGYDTSAHNHPTVVPDGHERVGETPVWEPYRDLCPHCGGEEFLHVTEETKVVYLDENGTCHSKPRDSKVLKIWCRDCDTRII